MTEMTSESFRILPTRGFGLELWQGPTMVMPKGGNFGRKKRIFRLLKIMFAEQKNLKGVEKGPSFIEYKFSSFFEGDKA
jgi:hypothetical protein